MHQPHSDNSGYDSPWRSSEHYFVGSAYGGTGAIGGLSSDDADAIDRILRRDGDLKVLSVDRKRLAESQEAWVFVRVDPKLVDGLLVSNLEVPSSAILTWPNSD
ncbi:MAG: DUF6210 family protein [Myxococcota bacterium]